MVPAPKLVPFSVGRIGLSFDVGRVFLRHTLKRKIEDQTLTIMLKQEPKRKRFLEKYRL